MQNSKPSNTISGLRDHLFATMAALRDDTQPMELDRAKAICEVGQTIINAAKVEVDLVKAMGGDPAASAFFNLPESRRIQSAAGAGAPKQIGDKKVHRFDDGVCAVCGAKQTERNEFATCPGAE